jgi:hypothetical protein
VGEYKPGEPVYSATANADEAKYIQRELEQIVEAEKRDHH